MNKAQKSPGRHREEETGIAISVDSSAFKKEVVKSEDDPFSRNIQAEFAMKVRGTCAVSYSPACSDETPSRLDLSMFPGAVTGQVLAEGLVNAAAAGIYGPHATVVLEADVDEDGSRKIYPDEILLRGFIGRRVRVIKTGHGMLVKKI